MKSAIDRIDLRILAELQANARLSTVELARRVNLTKTPCAERIRRLENSGVIRAYRAELDPAALEVAHVVFVEVLLSNTSAEALQRFNEAVRKIPEIQSCHMIAGDFDYLLKVRTRDIAEYRQVLGARISVLPGVQQTHTYVVMESVKDQAELAMEPTIARALTRS